MNIRRTAPGCHPPTAAAVDAATGPTGSAVVTDAAAPSSCRDAARAANANGATNGASSPELDCNHDNNAGPGTLTPRTEVTTFAEEGITDLRAGVRCPVAAPGPEA